MGYTHYWKIRNSETELFSSRWSLFIERAKTILEFAREKGILLGDGLGEEKSHPEISEEGCWFNGIQEEGHETFELSRKDTEFEFCKTERKPYDLIVCMCLLAASDVIGSSSFSFSSDGEWDDEWKEPRQAYALLFGEYRGPGFTSGFQDEDSTCQFIGDVRIPPHDPNRWRSTDGYEDPSATNGMSAARAAEQSNRPLDVDSDFTDYIVDLLHLAHSKEIEVEAILVSAEIAFKAEAGSLS